MDRCPHCERALPLVVDAYCGACGGRLDEPPERPEANVSGANPLDKNPAVTPSAVLTVGMILGGASILGVVMISGRGVAESVAEAVPALLLVVFGLARLSAPRPKGD